MRILDKHVLQSVLSVFFSCIFVFLFLYIIIDILSNLETILKQHADIMLLVRYYLLSLPIMFCQVSPFACLLSTLYALGKLNHDNEIIAMRSSGLSIFQISKTIIIMGFLISLAVFLLSDRVVPQSWAATQKLKQQMDEGQKSVKDKKREPIINLSLYGVKNRLYFINRYDPTTNTMERITVLEHDENQDITKKIVANKGVYEDGLWKFYQSITYNFDKNGQMIEEPQYLEEEIMAIPEKPSDFVNQRQRPEYMTIAELDDYIWKLSKSGAKGVIRTFEVSLYQRFTAPFTNAIIILLGIPFALIMRRRATGISSIGVSILVGFLYYVLEAVSIAIGKGGALPPLLAASLSHIIALSVSLYMIAHMP